MEEVVMFRNAQGETLFGVLTDHDQSGSDQQVVILCHGLLAHCSWRWIPTLAHVLCQRLAHSVFRFDFAGNGRSQGEWRFGAYRSQVQDLLAAIHYLKQRALMTCAIIGHSMGGDVALLYAAAEPVPYLHFVVNISGRFDLLLGVYDKFSEAQLHDLYEEGSFYMRVGQRTLTVTKESIDQRLEIDMRDEVGVQGRTCSCLIPDLAQVKNIPDWIDVLTVHGTDDNVVHVADSRQWGRHIRNHTLIELEGSDHKLEGRSNQFHGT